MNFNMIKKAVERKFASMMDNNKVLFQMAIDRDKLWNLYLDSIKPEFNPIYRTRREYDCSTCRHFIKRIGGVVAIHDGAEIDTVWDVDTGDEAWNEVCRVLAEYVKSCQVENIFASAFSTYGCEYDFGMDGEKYVHFYTQINSKFRFYDPDTKKGECRASYDVCKRGLDELTQESLEMVQELINQDSLYRGREHKREIDGFLRLKKEYGKLPEGKKSVFAWGILNTENAYLMKLRNTSIGTLLTDISDGMDLNDAVSRYETIVAPENYKRSKPIFTPKMLEEAKEKLSELGYLDSLGRRFATADDLTVNNILYINRDTAKQLQDADDLFGELAKDAKSSPKKFSRVEEISADDFVANVLPTAKEVYAYVENRHTGNFVSLIAPKIPDSKSMFKWDNNFSWAYSGNMTDSVLKQNVAKAGGNVNGVLRFSIQWNDLGEWNQNDEDAHCIEPNGNEIYYANPRSRNGGFLDVDIIHPLKGVPAVENIAWPSFENLSYGTYKFFVNTFSQNGGRGGFRAEIEFNGEIHSFDYTLDTKWKNNVEVAEITYNRDGTFTIKEKLPSNVSSRTVWGIKTNDFVPVSVVCYSPNYWDKQNGNGNLHYFFMLKGCVNDEGPNGFYNEFLNGELYPAHRKVMEAIGAKVKVEDSDDQLSGLGFSSTIRNDLVVKVIGATERILRVKF